MNPFSLWLSPLQAGRSGLPCTMFYRWAAAETTILLVREWTSPQRGHIVVVYPGRIATAMRYAASGGGGPGSP